MFMRSFDFYTLLPCLAAALMLIACNHHSDLRPDVLDGYWILDKATREAQITETLEGTWLAFDKTASTFESNLPLGFNEKEAFKIIDGKIQVASTPPFDLDVTAISDSTISLAFSARGFAFTLDLHKAERPSIEPNIAVPVEE